MKIELNKDLTKLNTFNIPANCKKYIEIDNRNELAEINFNEDFFILGGGSNILITKELSQIIKITANNIDIIEKNNDFAVIRAEAGTIWDNFVEFCVKNKFYGAENLSLIPGTVGAAPVQNIGAYGVEAQDIISKVEYFDISTKKITEIPANHCKFAYRNSIFKNELKQKAIITAAYFKLSTKPVFKLNYGGLSKFLDNQEITLENVRNAVISIRKSKLPDISQYPNAGSFFKNAIINEQKLCELTAKYKNIPYFKAPGGFKIPTAWLIEKAGLKGYSNGKAAVSDKHALILINENNATAQDILNLAKFIEQKIFDTFGIKIFKEIVII